MTVAFVVAVAVAFVVAVAVAVAGDEGWGLHGCMAVVGSIS